MQEKWQAYGNVGSAALDAVWGQIAETLNRQTECPSLPRPVIPAELGAGKTTCAKLWCSMLPQDDHHPGVLVVVRTVAQAEEFAADVNTWADAPVAFAYHSELKPRPRLDTVGRYPVVVICHRNYELALDEWLVEEPERYARLMRFRDRERKLAIVDEALDQVYVAQVSREQLQQMRSAVRDARIWKRHPQAVQLLHSVECALLDAPDGGFRVVSADALLEQARMGVAEADAALVNFWQEVRREKSIHLDNRRTVQESVTALRRHLAAYRWTESDGHYRALLGARLLLPPDAGQVILDATGMLNNVYTRRPDAYEVLQMAAVRDYRNVTLHVARTKGTGKTAMRKQGRQISQRALDAIHTRYGEQVRGRRVLVVTNKDSEEQVREMWVTAGFGALDVAHWKKIDGRNEWREFDTLVILTLPWARKSVDLSTFMAIRGVELDDAGLNAPPEDVRTIRETRIAAELAQAIGRIRLRRMTASDGSCEPCDVFVRFSHSFGVNVNTDHILDGLKRTLSGLAVVDWTAASQPRSPDGRPGKVGLEIGQQLLVLALSMEPGERLPLTKDRLPFSRMALHRTLANAQLEGHSLQASLSAIGAHVEPGGYRAGVRGQAPAELVRTP
jgi:hypothetical protein